MVAIQLNKLALSYFSANAERDWQFDSNGYDEAQLRAHVIQCGFALGRLHHVRCIVEGLDAFLAPRFYSVLAVVTALIGMGASLAI